MISCAETLSVLIRKEQELLKLLRESHAARQFVRALDSDTAARRMFLNGRAGPDDGEVYSDAEWAAANPRHILVYTRPDNGYRLEVPAEMTSVYSGVLCVVPRRVWTQNDQDNFGSAISQFMCETAPILDELNVPYSCLEVTGLAYQGPSIDPSNEDTDGIERVYCVIEIEWGLSE